jgi:hypothetical protein
VHGRVVLAGESLVDIGRDGLEAEHDEVDRLKVIVGESVAVQTVGLDGRVHPRAAHALEDVEHEAGLEEGLAPADREPAAHGAEALAVLRDGIDGALEGHGHAVGHLPGVGVVAEAAAELAPREPRDDPHAGAVDGRTGLEGVDEPEVAALDRGFGVGVARLLAHSHAQFVRAADEWGRCSRGFGDHGQAAP